jgi:hypothetical protein
VNQFRRVERELNLRAAQPPVRQRTQPVVHERDEPVASAFVPGAPSAQETCDFRRSSCHRPPG